MGLTFLAAGMSVPEAVSSVIVANQGKANIKGELIVVSSRNEARISYKFSFGFTFFKYIYQT